MKNRTSIKELRNLGYVHIIRYKHRQLFKVQLEGKRLLLSYNRPIGIYDNYDKIWYVVEEKLDKIARRQITEFSKEYTCKIISIKELEVMCFYESINVKDFI